LQLRAQACQQLGYGDATVNAYRDALEASSSSVALHRNLGVILFGLENWKDARPHLEIAYRSKPADSLSLLLMIAECLYHDGNYAGALERFKRAAEVRGPDSDLYRAIGACYYSMGDRVPADAAFREAARLAARTQRESASGQPTGGQHP